MALGENLEEVVTILTQLYSDQRDTLQTQYGQQAPMLAEEMGSTLGEMLISNTPFEPLWREFVSNPVSNEAELMGVLEMLEEAMPEITIALEGYYAGFVEMQTEPGDIYESSTPEPYLSIDEITEVESIADGDNDDEYREENAYLTGNVEDRSTSALYYENEENDLDPNQSEEG
jgi:hypothetical protein